MAGKKETPHLRTIRKQWGLNKLAAAKKVRFVDQTLELYKDVSPVQDLQTVMTAAHANEKIRRLANAETGKKIDDSGIFLCIWEPRDEKGHSLGKYFVYAAPEDLTDKDSKRGLFTYGNTIKRVSGLKDWHGFNGTNYKTDADLLKALKNGSYDGGWVIPPSVLLSGRDANGSEVYPDNLYAHREKGALSGTFTMAARHDLSDICPDWYWSSTEARYSPAFVRSIQFSAPGNSVDSKDGKRLLGCRPIRLEPAI
jgi:hypothetical protein